MTDSSARNTNPITAPTSTKGPEYFIFNTTINNYQTKPKATPKDSAHSFFQADFVKLLKLPTNKVSAQVNPPSIPLNDKAQTVRKKPSGLGIPQFTKVPKIQTAKKPNKVRTQSTIQGNAQNNKENPANLTKKPVPQLLGKHSSVTSLSINKNAMNKQPSQNLSPVRVVSRPLPGLLAPPTENESRSDRKSEQHQSLSSSPTATATKTEGRSIKVSNKSFSMNGKRYSSAMNGLNERYQREMLLLNKNMSASKIRVVARIRPLNKVEAELKENGAGDLVLKTNGDNKTLIIEDDNISFTLDGVASEEAQDVFYERVAKDTIDDILKGYNGTIFAYGPTGSGKTYTMLGPDIYDKNLMGIIPRASSQIFDYICSSDIEVEYELKCGMLEIYRENLRDLLIPESEQQQSELKIKECPIRGIYVEGLSEQYIVSRDEFMSVVQKGEQARVVAETKLNRFSSRSHTLFILQITQKFTNGTVKTGRLNLVDLAGSEKLARTGVQDERMEETKKINKSLSALGNVIHALTNGSEHVPYRDSKLTRILQESLGGNYKTTLVVTLSPFSSCKDETLSSIKFAQRARNVKNRVHINFKQSPENLYRIIESLQNELNMTKHQLEQMKMTLNKTCNSVEGTPAYIKLISSTFSEELSGAKNNCRNTLNSAGNPTITQTQTTTDLLMKCYGINTNSDVKPEESRNLAKGLSIMDGIGEKDISEIKISQTNEETVNLKQKLLETEKALSEAQDEIRKLKKDRLRVEQKSKEYEDSKAITMIKELKKNMHEQHTQTQLEVLQKEVESLTRALMDCEEECRKLLTEKREKFRSAISGEMQKAINFKECRLEDYSNSLFETDENLCGQIIISQNKTVNPDVKIELEEAAMLCKSAYAEQLGQELVGGKLPAETQIFLLKQQLIDAAIYNHSLQRVLSTLEWKQYIEQNKLRLKSTYCNFLENCNQELDSVLDKTYHSHCRLRKRIEKFEAELYELREKNDGNTPLNTETSVITRTNPNTKIKLVKTFTRKSLQTGENANMPPRPKTKQNFTKIAYPNAKSENPINLNEAIEIIKEKDNEISRLAQLIDDKTLQEDRLYTEDFAVNTSENDRLSDKIMFLKTELDLQVSRAEQLRKAYMNAKMQLKSLKELTTEIEKTSKIALKDENESWQRITNGMKQNYESELYKKQKEITELHEILAEWIMKYMELEKQKGIAPSIHTKLLVETLKHRRNCSNAWLAQIAEVAFTGRASKKVEKAMIVIDPATNKCVEIKANSGLGCGNKTLAPDSLPIKSDDIKGDSNPNIEIE